MAIMWFIFLNMIFIELYDLNCCYIGFLFFFDQLAIVSFYVVETFPFQLNSIAFVSLN